jgi:ferredoxin
MGAHDPLMGLEVEIDRDACMGSGNCVYEAQGVFDFVAFVVDPTGSAEDKLVAAALNCPTHAITVRRDGVTLV